MDGCYCRHQRIDTHDSVWEHIGEARRVVVALRSDGRNVGSALFVGRTGGFACCLVHGRNHCGYGFLSAFSYFYFSVMSNCLLVNLIISFLLLGLSATAICAPSDKFLTMGAPLAMGFMLVFAANIGSFFFPPHTALGASKLFMLIIFLR